MNRQAIRKSSRVAAVLLVASGILSVAAAALRWPGCLGADPGYGCVRAQDHVYDYMLPAAPWSPVAGAAELSGSAFILLAAALVALAQPLQELRGLRGCFTALAGIVFLVGVTALASGLAGAPADAGWVTPLRLAYDFVWPVGMAAAAMVLLLERTWAMAVALLVLAGGTPLAEYLVLVRLSGSHDTPPWSGAYHGALTIVGGLILAVPAFPAAAGCRNGPVPPRSGGQDA